MRGINIRRCDSPYNRTVYSISSYGDRPNTYEEVSEYFRAHFIQIHRRKDISRRILYTVRSLSSAVTLAPHWPSIFAALHVYAGHQGYAGYYHQR